ncbi:hypothetical protein JCM15908A_14340 [Prevotella dentasini JCM 15908]
MKGKQWVEAAIYLPAEYLKAYAGAEITAVRAALTNRIGIDTLRAWVRTDLKADNMASGEVTTKSTPQLKKKWNDITLNTPVKIEEGKGLYIGFSYYQRKDAEVVSFVGNGMPNSFFFRRSKDAEWEDMHTKGLLSVEAVVTGNSLPTYDAAVIDASVKRSESGLSMKTSIYNAGTKDITGLDLEVNGTDGVETVSKHFDQEIASGKLSEITFDLPYTDLKTGLDTPLSLNLVSVANGQDVNKANDKRQAAFAFAKKVLLEEFTGTGCGYCPGLVYNISDALRDEKCRQNTYVVCHHSGYTSDRFTVPADEEYLWFYNDNGTYGAPKMMCNRQPFTMHTGGMSPVWQPQNGNDVKHAIEGEMASDAYATFTKVEGQYNSGSRKLTIHLAGMKSREFSEHPVRLTVYLTENGIDGSDQADYFDIYKGKFIHNHVVRGYNSTWGAVINWKEKNFDYDVSFTIDPSWVKDNLEVIAIINAYDPQDPANCRIENVGGITFPAITGIQHVDNTSGVSTGIKEYYNIDGVKVLNPENAHGLLIVKEKMADGRVVSKKIIQ